MIDSLDCLWDIQVKQANKTGISPFNDIHCQKDIVGTGAMINGNNQTEEVYSKISSANIEWETGVESEIVLYEPHGLKALLLNSM